MTLDRFGISMLAPSLEDGRVWNSKWDQLGPRGWQAGGLSIRSNDPFDSESFLHSIVSENAFVNKCFVDGGGIMRMGGPSARFYVSNNNAWWCNVEITVYCKTVAQIVNGSSSVQLMLCGRTDHDNEWRCPCDAHGYYGEFRNDGSKRIRKELKLGIFGTDATGTAFAGATFPIGSWVGMKLIIRNKSQVFDSTVPVQVDVKVYNDLTDGVGGGTWTQVVNRLDIGNWTTTLGNIQTCIDNAEDECRQPTVDVDKVYDAMSPSCFLGCDNWTCDYKKMSIREVRPLP
jgi:hypothetical protein